MNRRLILYTLGKVVCMEAALMILPLVVCIIYHEPIRPFAISIAVTGICGIVSTMALKTHNDSLYIRDGFVIVSSAWIAVSIFGALPFVISGSIPNFADAFFETISGFTTTGASIIPDVEVLGKGILFWRSFTHWIGGMGVLVFILAIAERNPERSINILRAEMPGSKVDKLKPKAKTTAMNLYYIYLVITIVEVIFLLAGKMPLYDSLVHAFGTAGTGGFGIKGDSIGGYSPYLQYVIAIFMLIFGVNFGLYYLVLLRKGRSLIESMELRLYLLIAGVSTIAITIIIHSQFPTWEESFRHSLFQVASIMTTTGYSTVDFNLWPQLSKAILLVIMFIGGCEGSTAGGLKVSRALILGKTIKNEVRRALHPRIVSLVRVNGKALTREAVSGVSAYFALYVFTMVCSFLLISWESMGFETNFTAVVACMNNIGPGFAGVGPAANFAAYSDFSKIVLSFTMLLGRLEIFPIILSFYASNARK